MKFPSPSSSPKPLITLSCPEFKSHSGTLFKQFSFQWNKGEHWGLLGPNGSGKSVFMRLLSGDLYSRTCNVDYYFPGLNGGDPEARIEIVSLEQQAELLAGLDAYVQMRWNSFEEDSTPTLALWLSQDSVERITPYERTFRTPTQVAEYTRDLKKVTTQLELTHLLDRNVTSLSNGEMRRSLIARALLANPRIILFDAPLLGLDAHSRTIVQTCIQNIISNGKISTLFASVRPEELPGNLTHILSLPDCSTTPAAQPAVETCLGASPSTPAAKPAPSPIPCASTKGAPTDFDNSSSATAVVHLDSVTIRYGDHTVFDSLNWTIRKGERWLLTGPNGSGKSTLLALMIGDHPQAYANKISIFGKPRGKGESIWDIKKRIGWVSPELHACMSTGEMVIDIVLTGFTDTTVCTKRPTRKRILAAEAALGKINLKSRAYELFGTLSSGEQRLVLLARACVKNPPLLILDEPCQNLDEQNRALFVSMLDTTCTDSDTTLVYVTHLTDTLPSCITHHMSLIGN